VDNAGGRGDIIDMAQHKVMRGFIDSLDRLAEVDPQAAFNGHSSLMEGKAAFSGKFGDLRTVDLGGEGHCQFRVLSDIAYSDGGANYRTVRHRVGVCLRMFVLRAHGVAVWKTGLTASSRNKYADYDAFVYAIIHGSEWGANLTLTAFATAYRLNVCVLTSLNGGSMFPRSSCRSATAACRH
jgi:hypothetical protein